MVTQAGIAAALVLTYSALAPAQVRLPGGEVVPRDSFVVYIFIGHSNMAGRGLPLDSSVTERTWNYWIPDGYQSYDPYTWVTGKQPFHKDDEAAASGVALYVLRNLAVRHPGMHFGAVQNATAGATASWSYSAPGGDLFREMCGALRRTKGTVTLGGILCMLGVCDAYTQSSSRQFCENAARTVAAFRDSLGEPSLPFLIGEFEDGGPPDNSHPYWQIVQGQIDSIPGRIPFSAIVSSDSLTYRDLWHYDSGGIHAWAARATAIVERDYWPPASQALRFEGLPFPTPVFINDTVHIRWTTGAASIPSVGLTISADDGLTWAYLTDPILANRPDYGDYQWIVRDSVDTVSILGKTCMLRITDYDGKYEDVSNSFLVADRDTRCVRSRGRTISQVIPVNATRLTPATEGRAGPRIRVRSGRGPDQTVSGRAVPRSNAVDPAR